MPYNLKGGSSESVGLSPQEHEDTARLRAWSNWLRVPLPRRFPLCSVFCFFFPALLFLALRSPSLAFGKEPPCAECTRSPGRFCH